MRNEFSIANTINVTVEENLVGFSARQSTAIENAQRVYKALGHPSFDNFLRVIKSNYIKDLPVTEADARNMISAYGPDVHALRGKAVRRRAPHVPSSRRILPPDSILRANKNVVLCVDIFFVDSIPFILAVSRNI